MTNLIKPISNPIQKMFTFLFNNINNKTFVRQRFADGNLRSHGKPRNSDPELLAAGTYYLQTL